MIIWRELKETNKLNNNPKLIFVVVTDFSQALTFNITVYPTLTTGRLLSLCWMLKSHENSCDYR